MKKVLLVLGILVFINGCIDYKDKISLNKNGSGSFTFAIGFSSALANMDKDNNSDFNMDSLAQGFKNAKGIRFVSERTYTSEGTKWSELTLDFDSLAALEHASKNDKSAEIMGTFKLSMGSDGDITFTRIINTKREVEKDTSGFGEALGKGFAAMMFGNNKWSYELKFPGDIVSANTPDSLIDKKNHVVRWVYPMSEIISGQVEMKAVFSSPEPANDIIMITGFTAALVIFVAYAISKRKKKS